MLKIEILKQKIKQGRLDLRYFRTSGMHNTPKARALEISISKWEAMYAKPFSQNLHLKKAVSFNMSNAYIRCVAACKRIMLNIDYHTDYCAGEEACRIEVQKLSMGKISYYKPMAEALRDLGLDI